ncbi:carcinoembryonic antigen-related cell adhesion molecule 21-like isoform X2 [Sciurus carolinensis]|uniref:carcinoembryonic antigen-related cell adhesion molecule 21-like isoform X2 n=1 Tax=Sciurus carolinensis TaxID=30640 RepID=UPI001FB27313|nr:carcinoembryonic antigen-related cell adhesion molecule 21-like isoform X2 [Sciurus carolinensis]
MQPPSACACRGCIPWQGILLAVSLLTFWSPHPTAQLTIQPVPVDAAEGTDVLLLAHHGSENLVGYTWFKGNMTDSRHRIVSYLNVAQIPIPGTAFSGRETIYPNGSLLFVNVTQEDTGFYTLQTIRKNFSNEVATGEFRVHELVTQPTIQATNTAPGSVVMTCLSDDSGISIMWIFNSRTLQFTERMQLSQDHRTLSIDPVRQEDDGEYQCEVSNAVSSSRSDPFRLAVISEEKTSGLSVGAIAGIVTGVLVGVALVAALGCFLLHTRTGRTSVQHGHRGRHTPASTPGSLAHWTTQKHRVSPRTCCLTKHLKTEDPRHLLQQGPSPPHTLLNSCLCPQAKVPLMASPPWPLSLVTAMLFPSTRN